MIKISLQFLWRRDDVVRWRTAVAVVGDAEHEPQQTLGAPPLHQQHLGVAGQAEEEAERDEGVGRHRRDRTPAPRPARRRRRLRRRDEHRLKDLL